MTLVSKEKKEQSLKAFNALDDILGKRVVESKKPVATPLGLDIKGVELPPDFTDQLFESSQPAVKTEVKKAQKPSIGNEAKLSELVSKLSALLQEAKTLMSEMTTTGMLGTNQKFVLGKKKSKLKGALKYKDLFKGK